MILLIMVYVYFICWPVNTTDDQFMNNCYYSLYNNYS